MSFFMQENKSNKLILFVTGWGMDENPTLFMDDGNYDVLTLYDYPTLQNLDLRFDKYKEITLVAWSLGILAANFYLDNRHLKFDRCIAINGSGLPVHDKYGIPHKIVELTLKTWSENARGKFNSLMFSINADLERFLLNSSKRDIKNQKEELEWCKEKALIAGQSNNLNWDLAFIGSNDKIFPPENLGAYWLQSGTEIKKNNWSHFPFYQCGNWTKFIDDSKGI